MTATSSSRPLASIRTASPADIDAIRKVTARAYAEYEGVLAPDLYRDYLANLLDVGRRADDGATVLIAEADDRIVGTVSLYLDAGPTGFGWPTGWAAIRALAVDPDQQGHGTARRLVEAAIERATAGASPVLGLHTAEFMAAAVRLYERLGFTRDAAFDVEAADVLDVAGGDAPRVIAYRLDLPPSPDPYALGRSVAETRRLILQHQMYGPITRHLLTAAGVSRGMKVLDLGSGAGDVALALAEIVGPEGRVVGVDMNPAILETARRRVDAAGWANVRFDHGDVRALADDGDFDAVVGRWILMYLPNPADLLRHVAARTRPGGIVSFLESANLAEPVTAFPRSPLHDLVTRWTTPPPGARGPALDMGLRLYRTFLDAGLPAPQLRLEAPIGGGADWPGYAYVAETLRSLLPFLEQIGAVSAAEADVDTLADRLRAEVVANRGVQILPTVIGAWSRRT
jgi:predicted N-acetyltransferase YhbS/SAM-dependent methyltransferase